LMNLESLMFYYCQNHSLEKKVTEYP